MFQRRKINHNCGSSVAYSIFVNMRCFSLSSLLCNACLHWVDQYQLRELWDWYISFSAECGKKLQL